MMLEGNGLSIAFGGVRAVTGVTLRIERGELVGLIGPNGAGKTTLLRLLTGVLAPDAGSVKFEARDVTRTPIHLWRKWASCSRTRSCVRSATCRYSKT